VADNFLYYGDNLDVLSRHVASESVDLSVSLQNRDSITPSSTG
jgi:hypothetical protein